MKCLILAAGYATRLYPLTENFPKPLLTVGEKTILDWLVVCVLADCVFANAVPCTDFVMWKTSEINKIVIYRLRKGFCVCRNLFCLCKEDKYL